MMMYLSRKSYNKLDRVNDTNIDEFIQLNILLSYNINLPILYTNSTVLRKTTNIAYNLVTD